MKFVGKADRQVLRMGFHLTPGFSIGLIADRLDEPGFSPDRRSCHNKILVDNDGGSLRCSPRREG
jgi:hypothetical protein